SVLRAARRRGRALVVVVGGRLERLLLGRPGPLRRRPPRHLVGELGRPHLRRPALPHPRPLVERVVGGAADVRRGLAQLAPRGAGLRPPRRPQGPARPERAADPRVRAGGLGPSRPLAGPVPPLRPPHRPPAVTPSSRRNARTARPPVARTAAATR